MSQEKRYTHERNYLVSHPYSRAANTERASAGGHKVPGDRPPWRAEGVIHPRAKEGRKKGLFTTGCLQAHSPEEHTSEASGEGPYHTYGEESRGEDIIIIKLNRRKKRLLYSLSNKSSYIGSSDDMES